MSVLPRAGTPPPLTGIAVNKVSSVPAPAPIVASAFFVFELNARTYARLDIPKGPVAFTPYI